MGSKKLTVCINVSPSWDYLEIVQIEAKEGAIEKASSLPAKGGIDPVMRQIEDADQLARIVKDLYDTNRIPFNSPTVLVLPSFFTREIDLPAEFTPEELRLTLTSEAERYIIFKKNEPQVAWNKLNDSTILYSAFPKNEIEKLTRLFQNNRIPLIGIELNYLSVLRGLIATGAVSGEVSEKQRWCLLIISDQSFFAAICEGSDIQKTMESPLSIASDNQSKVAEIQQDLEQFFGFDSLSKLVLINNSQQLASEQLIGRLNVAGEIVNIEQNNITLRSRGDAQALYPCSLEAIGGGLCKQFPDLPGMNFIPESADDVVSILNIRRLSMLGLLIANGGALLICGLVFGVMSLMIWFKESEIQQTTENFGKVKSGHSAADVYRKIFIKNQLDLNEKTNNLLVKLGALIPSDVWVTQVTVDMANATIPQTVEIKGGSIIPEPVSQFVNDLSKSLKREDLEVSKVELANSQDGQSYYDWIIQTKIVTPPAGSPSKP